MNRHRTFFRTLTVLVALIFVPAATVSAQGFRRLFQHRNVWVENIASCPTDVTDRIIDIFRERGRRIRLINVNPPGRESTGNCRTNAVFMVYLYSDDREYYYPGYTRSVERNGRFVPHAWGEVEDLPFRLDEPRLRVVEIVQGSMYLTEMSSHFVNVSQGADLLPSDVDKIVEKVHERYGPGIDRRIKGDMFIRGLARGRAAVSFVDVKDKERTYQLEKTGRDWKVTGPDESFPRGQRPLGGGK